MAARFAPVNLEVDLSSLSAGDKQALPKLIEAAQLLNVVFMKQYWSGNLATYEKLKADKTPLGQARLQLLLDQQGTVVESRRATRHSCPAFRRASLREQISIPKT